jgi:hypothetical protein
MRSALYLFLAVLAGCTYAPGKIRLGKHSVTAPADAQAPAVLNEGHRTEVLTLPKGSTITRTPTPSGGESVEYSLSSDTTQTTTEDTTHAEVPPPRPPDQTVALKKVANNERRPFLYIGAGLAAVAGFFLYRHLMVLAKLTGLGAAVCFVFWWAIGNEQLLTYCFIGLAVLTAGYFIYADWRKRRIEGALRTTEQSIAEFSVDHPAVAKSLKEEYLDVNRDEAHKEEAAKAAAKMDRSYLAEQIEAKIAKG